MSDGRVDGQRRRRSGPEWVTFSVSLVILVVVVGLLVSRLDDADDPASPAVTILDHEIEARDGMFHVPVEVRNDGGRAAANVQVRAELVAADGTESSEQTIDYLGAGETDRLVFVFAADPATGELTVAVGGFAVP